MATQKISKITSAMIKLKDLLRENYSIRDFINLGHIQRGRPENAMLKVQRIMGGGILNPVVEHAGDIMHRMNDGPTFKYAGYEYVKTKVELCIKYLTSSYGFVKEFKENVANNKTDYEELSKALL